MVAVQIGLGMPASVPCAQGEKSCRAVEEANPFMTGITVRTVAAMGRQGHAAMVADSSPAAGRGVKIRAFENGNKTQLVIAMPGNLELD